MTATITTQPQYLNANTLKYTAWDLRRFTDDDPAGPGVADIGAFKVIQRQAGANMSVDVGATGVGLMRGWVRGTTRGGQGLYRVDNIDTTAPTTDTYIGQINDTITANASGNPRLDMVILEVLDQQHSGASNLAQIRVVAGTPNAGATLDTRTGAAALPANAILLADVIVANGAASIVTANIRDRRQFPIMGTIPAINPIDAVTPVPSAAFTTIANAVIGTGLDATQAAALFYIPRRIVGATRVRWKYSQGGTALTGNWNIGIYDASGTLIVATGSTAFTGALNTVQNVAAAITATTFEPGAYYVVIGLGTLATGTVIFSGCQMVVSLGTVIGPNVGGVALRSGSGGISLPNSILAYTDVGTATSAIGTHYVPLISLSVG